MLKEIRRVIEGVKVKLSENNTPKDIRSRQDFEKNLLLKYGDNAAEIFLNERDFFERQLVTLVNAKKKGIVLKDDYDNLDNEARELLPKEIIIK